MLDKRKRDKLLNLLLEKIKTEQNADTSITPTQFKELSKYYAVETLSYGKFIRAEWNDYSFIVAIDKNLLIDGTIHMEEKWEED